MVPQCSIGAIKPKSEAIDRFRELFRDFYENPEPYAMEPFRIYGNLYYVGDRKVCMHLLDTEEGLILFDCGYGHTTDMIEGSIRKLGFDPADLKYIVVTHGHFDHFGSGNVLRQRYGCKVLLSGVDTRLLQERPDRALVHLGPCPEDEICWPDVLLEDGDEIVLGSMRIRCVLAPGHTYGTMAFFFPVTQDGVTRSVGYWGGAGLTTMYGDLCREYGMPADKCRCMTETLKKLKQEQVEITLGNHPPQNCTLEKRQWMLDHPGENPFIHPDGWQTFLNAMTERLAEFVAAGYGD